MPLLDIIALIVFVLCWLFYEPMLKRLSIGRHLNSNMTIVRSAWMANMAARESRFIDAQLMGHALNSASFFASTNLIVIAGAAGVLFGGERSYRSLEGVVMLDPGSRLMFQIKLTLMMIILARGLLDFIWAIRQMNYTLAAIGAAPEKPEPKVAKAYGEAVSLLINPALGSFNAGVRGYYFALACTAWLAGPIPFCLATVGATGLLVWRQSSASAAKGVRKLREILDAHRPD